MTEKATLWRDRSMSRKTDTFHQVTLLGLLPLLGGTTRLSTAIFLVISSFLVALMVRFTSFLLPSAWQKKTSWVFTVIVGLSISYGVTAWVFPFYIWGPEEILFFVLLLGITPLTYLGCVEGCDWNTFFRSFLLFSLLMPGIAVIREFFGQGIFLGISFMESGFAPLSIFAEPGGGFITLGLIILLYRFVPYLTAKNERKEK